MPKVSIIVPVYNVEKYLDRCMQTLLSQTLEDIEIVLVDDGSPDNCPKLCDEYAKKDPRVKVVHKENGGLGSARNSGLDVATGEYVAFVDSDDYNSVEAYEVLYNKAKETDADIVYAGFTMQNSDGTKSKCFVLDHTWVGKDITAFLQSMIFDTKPDIDTIWMSVWNGLYKRDLIERNKIRFFSEREYLSEDILFHTMLVPLCKKIVCIPQTFYHYCYNGTSLTHSSFNVRKIECNIRLFEKLSEIAESYHLPEIKKEIFLFFENYTRGIILRGIILSDMSMAEKCRLCNKVYEYKGWKTVRDYLKDKHIPKKERLGLFLITNRLFLLNVLLFKIYYIVLGKSKYEE